VVQITGKRGIFYGVVENMHKQWKHRELVKLIVKGMEQEELQRTARMLEYVSGGILVAVVPTSKGQAIIMYRGKDYEGRWSLQPHNLLTRKEAFKRSAEMQHCVVWAPTRFFQNNILQYF
jgi:RNA-binding protein YhbY